MFCHRLTVAYFKGTWHRLPRGMRTDIRFPSCVTAIREEWWKFLTENKSEINKQEGNVKTPCGQTGWNRRNTRSNIKVAGRWNSQIWESPSFKWEMNKSWESWKGKKRAAQTKKNEKQRERLWKSAKFVILPPFGDPALNGIQKLVSFSEQIADLPQNRGCLSWDGVKEREKGDARKAWEREERKNRNREMERRIFDCAKQIRGGRWEMRCLGNRAVKNPNDSFYRNNILLIKLTATKTWAA